MLDGPAVVAVLKQCGITHVVWIPDSELGTWEPALRAEPGPRPTRAPQGRALRSRGRGVVAAFVPRLAAGCRDGPSGLVRLHLDGGVVAG